MRGDRLCTIMDTGKMRFILHSERCNIIKNFRAGD